MINNAEKNFDNKGLIQKYELEYFLYYEITCPLSRQVRILLEENELKNSIIKYNKNLSEEQKNLFLKKNPFNIMPFLVVKNNINNATFEVYGISNCINIVNSKCKNLIPSDLEKKIITNNLLYVINTNFFEEITKIIIYEKITKYSVYKKAPDSLILSNVRKNLIKYLNYFAKMINVNTNLSTEQLSLADIALFSHISLLDYVNEIDWNKHEILKEWYLIIKSKPNFRKVLNEFIPGFVPSYSYKNLDF
ncbi:MAG: glutathione S-transferase family protein [Rickettsiales bacterium]